MEGARRRRRPRPQWRAPLGAAAAAGGLLARVAAVHVVDERRLTAPANGGCRKGARAARAASEAAAGGGPGKGSRARRPSPRHLGDHARSGLLAPATPGPPAPMPAPRLPQPPAPRGPHRQCHSPVVECVLAARLQQLDGLNGIDHAGGEIGRRRRRRWAPARHTTAPHTMAHSSAPHDANGRRAAAAGGAAPAIGQRLARAPRAATVRRPAARSLGHSAWPAPFTAAWPLSAPPPLPLPTYRTARACPPAARTPCLWPPSGCSSAAAGC
jgi:hypothetical protein